MIVREIHGVTILGGGRVYAHDLVMARSYAPTLVAADGSVKYAINNGWIPRAVIGDMDSLDVKDKLDMHTIPFHYIAEQQSTDFDKCLRNISAPFVLGIGLTGGLLDHELANLSTLLRYPDVPCIIIGEESICCLAPQYLRLILPVGTRVSLFPLSHVRGKSTGLYWPIDTVLFAPNKRIGTSNKTTDREVTLRFSHNVMLLILEREHLPALLRGLGVEKYIA